MGPESLVPLGWGRWRVLDGRGAASGLIEEIETGRGSRFRALRYRWSSRAFVEVGEFWNVDDAVASLRSV
jgi:hypothetical protein